MLTVPPSTPAPSRDAQRVTWRSWLILKQRDWLILITVVGLLSLIPLVLTYRFSLPYIDHPDEPSAYYKALEFRGLWKYDLWEGYPPAYLGAQMVMQTTLEMLGVPRYIGAVMPVARWFSAVLTLLTTLIIAATAKRIAGSLAGILAGLTWALSPIILEYGVYATTDPSAAFFVSLALWLAVVALTDERRRWWCVLSVIAGLIATLCKYNLLPAIIPGGLVALYVTSRDWRRGIRFLIAQVMVVLIVAVWLVGVYHVERAAINSGPMESRAMSEVRSISSFFKMDAVTDNLLQVLDPLRASPVIAVGVLSVVCLLIFRREMQAHVHLGAVLLTLIVMVTIPYVVSIYSTVRADGRIRDVIPATAAACVLLGVALTMVLQVLARLGGKWAAGVGLLAFGVLVAMPQISAQASLIADRRREDTRTVIRAWAEASLEPGLVVVDRFNHKLFNPYFSGLQGAKWFEWLVDYDMTAKPPQAWHDERGLSYMVLPIARRDEMLRTSEGQAYLAAMLHLRDFGAPPSRRGEDVAVYRLWSMQVQQPVTFSSADDQQIVLQGFDRSGAEFKAGEAIQVRLYWQALTKPTLNYSVFLHVYPADSLTLLAQADGAPAISTRPTVTWDDPDETLISDLFTIQLPATLASGTYRMAVGLYDPITGVRLNTGEGQDYTTLFTIMVR